MAPSRPSRRAVIRPLLLALLLAGLLAVPASSNAAGWTSITPVTGDPGGGRTVTGVTLAADPAGDQVAVWIEQPSPFKVQAAVRPAGGAWGPAPTLDSSATTLPTTDVAVDAAGNFIVLYSEVIATNKKVFSAYLPAGQTTFGAPQQFGSTLSGATTLTGIAVALDAQNGTAYAVMGIGGAVGIGGSRLPGAASGWTINSTGLPTGSGNSIDLAVGTDGVPTLADYPGASGALRHTRFNGSSWVTITTPAGVGNASGTVVVKPDAGGRTTTLYQIASTFTQLGTQSCPPGTLAATQCTNRTQLALGGTTSTLAPALAVAPNGDAAAVWTENTAVVSSQRSGPGGAWVAASQVGTGTAPAVVFASNGGTAAAFSDSSRTVSSLLAPAGSALAPPSIPVTAAGWNAPALAADGLGDLFGVWSSAAGTGIDSALYDAEPPSTPAITAPGSAFVGDAVAFQATATDRWSAVAYTWDFGAGATARGAAPSHAYAAPGSYTARVTATDGGGNQSTQAQTVTVSATPTPPPPPGLSRPIAGKTVNLELVTGTVLVKVPGSGKFVPLVTPTQVRNGAIIDARKGRVRITIDNGRGGLDTADFYGGVFKFTQPKVKAGALWFANLYLYGGSFKGCPTAPKNPKLAIFSRKKQAQGKSVRKLWGSGGGAFRTVGRFSSATVRGTTWLTDDRCKGTLTKVTAGKVGVRDFVLQKTIVLKRGKTYFAQPAPRKKR
jgi:hypothetical protein